MSFSQNNSIAILWWNVEMIIKNKTGVESSHQSLIVFSDGGMKPCGCHIYSRYNQFIPGSCSLEADAFFCDSINSKWP